MNPKQRFVVIGKRFAVKRFVFFFRALFRIFCIQRKRGVQRFVFFSLFGIQINVKRHKRAVFADQPANGIFLQKLFFFRRNVHYDFCSARLLFAIAERIRAVSVRFPMHARRTFFIRFREYFDVFRNHVSGIKPKPEMPDNSVAASFFVFRYEIRRARKGDLCNIRFHFFGGHADSVIFYGKRFCLAIRRNGDFIFLFVERRFAHFF